jgi:hypothetical protein
LTDGRLTSTLIYLNIFRHFSSLSNPEDPPFTVVYRKEPSIQKSVPFIHCFHSASVPPDRRQLTFLAAARSVAVAASVKPIWLTLLAQKMTPTPLIE